VGRLFLYHHHPYRHDSWLDDLVSSARTIFPATYAAREGIQFEI